MRQIATLLVFLTALAAGAQPERVTITIDPEVREDPYSGRVYLVFAKEGEPRERLNAWFNPPPAAAWDVENLQPGEATTLEGFDLFHASEQFDADWMQSEWVVQGVARVSRTNPRPGEGAGDLYSEPVTINFDDLGVGDILAELTLDRVVEKEPFEETERTKLFTMKSELLSEFHGFPYELRASVTLPDAWFDNENRRFPIVYYITGFGGDEGEVLRYLQGMPHRDLVGDAIVVGLDATNYWGHSVFADSAVTGPWGSALTEELIPALEAKYRGPEDPAHRYVTGISSGGWGSLWVQVEYPETFAGVWSHVPDPVDFRAFQTVDLSAENANMYTDENSDRRPLGRQGDRVMFWADDFIARETMLGPGGQIRSFEAVFSPAREDGSPVPLFDRETGEVDPETVRAWEAYDIRAKLDREWDEIGDELAGKLHVFGGEADNFYLGEAVGLLRESLEERGADAEVIVLPGMPHTFYWLGDKQMWETIHERWDESGG